MNDSGGCSKISALLEIQKNYLEEQKKTNALLEVLIQALAETDEEVAEGFVAYLDGSIVGGDG